MKILSQFELLRFVLELLHDISSREFAGRDLQSRSHTQFHFIKDMNVWTGLQTQSSLELRINLLQLKAIANAKSQQK